MIQKISTRDGYGKKLVELENKDIVVLTADLGESSRVKPFAEKYPERFIQVGISEQDMFGIANGLGISGKIPITNTFSSFCLRGTEQIRLICINNSNVKIIGHHSGISLGKDGVSQMCENDIAIMRSFPNMIVIAPCDAIEAQKALSAIISHDGPAYLRLSREPVSLLTNEYSDFVLGKANILKEGDDVLIVACGMMVEKALIAAKILGEKNISAAVMNMHTIKPLDSESLIQYAQKTKAIVTVEEHSIYGGLGSAVSETLSLTKIPIKILGLKDVFGESGNSEELFEKFGLTAQNISDYCIDVLKFKDNKKINVREVEDLIKDIDCLNPELEEQNTTQIDQDLNLKTTSEKNSGIKNYDKDPRNRITKVSPEQKKQLDNVLEKMFGGRRKN